jgi:hypothetical protein
MRESVHQEGVGGNEQKYESNLDTAGPAVGGIHRQRFLNPWTIDEKKFVGQKHTPFRGATKHKGLAQNRGMEHTNRALNQLSSICHFEGASATEKAYKIFHIRSKGQ